MWFLCPCPRPNAKQRLFFFPYAGGSPNNFRSWIQHLPESIELMVIRLPGRDFRLKETPFSDWKDLLDGIETALLPFLDKPYLFFGHSFGARIIYELTKIFQIKKIALPSCLFISGCQAPHIPSERPFLHQLPKEAFIARLRAMKGTHQAILENSMLFNLLEPTIRADICLSELWEDCPKKQLNPPIIGLSGIDDPLALPSKMQEWSLYTTSPFSLYTFSGEHFFIHTHEKEVLELVTNIASHLDTFPHAINLNATAFSYPNHLTIPAVFEENSVRFSNKTALIFKDTSLTYEQLNHRSNQLAHFLLRQGVKVGNIVAVNLPRSLEMIIAFLAILKTGSAYLPLDTHYPEERLTYMLENAQVIMLINTEMLEAQKDNIAKENIENLAQPFSSSNMAYVNYTSGSTGQPKGVVIPHQAVLRLLFSANYADLNENNIFLQLSSVSFDAATFEIWGSLLHGGQCILLNGKLQTIQTLSHHLEHHSVNILFLTTALFNTIIDENSHLLSNVKQLLTGGESHSISHIKKAWQLLPNTQIISVYGPTESTTFASYYPVTNCPDDTLSSLPIGRPISNTQIYILNKNHQLVLPGETGELCIGGDGLALKYLNREDLTTQKFINNLSFLPPEKRLYKTGDCARYLPDGNIEFLGRTDDQVKLNGFRIELGEIEAFLRLHDNIKQAVVLVDKKKYDQQKLIAFLVAEHDEMSSNEMRKYLQKKLPAYMIPSHYNWLKSFPLTINGKIDKQLLFNQQ